MHRGCVCVCVCVCVHFRHTRALMHVPCFWLIWTPFTAGKYIRDTFANAIEIECFGGSVKYRIGSQNMALADIFEYVCRKRVCVPPSFVVCHLSIFMCICLRGCPVVRDHRKLEGVKSALSISNYAISQTSLEQVFIHFASEGQRAEADAEIRLKGGAVPEARVNVTVATSPSV
jgi:hypothetical protein